MIKRLWALTLASIILLLCASSAAASTLGPVDSYDALCDALMCAADGDVILVTGDLTAESREPLAPSASVRISSGQGEYASIRGLRLRDASVAFDNIRLDDSLEIDGTSNILLGSNVAVSGSDGQSGLSFSGKGTLIVERGCTVEGGSESAGISIRHNGGDFYGSIEGAVSGGSGSIGGAGVVISPLGDAGAVMITGSIQGGKGASQGGHALNLYDLSGNAYVTVDGALQGGDGSIGGDGIQLISANDNVNVGIGGRVKGGSGESFGGSALILMNAAGSSSFNLSGAFSGGDALAQDAQPGASLQLVGDSVALRTRISDCILEEGRPYADEQQSESAEQPPEPTVTPLPEITSSIDDITALATQEPTPFPEESSTPEPTQSPDPSPEPSPDAAAEIDAPADSGTSAEATPVASDAPDAVTI